MSGYSECLQQLFSINLFGGIKLGLTTMHRLLKILNHPEKRYLTLHVAGTNGKGSVCTKIAKALEYSGYRTGLYTSPHLSSFRERIRINGTLISEEAVLQGLEMLFNIREREQVPATFFEITTALAFDYFAKEHVDVAVIETGLGGRLDATNVISPLLSIITSISLEHTDVLGTTLEEIALEKGGIIKPGVPVLIGPRTSASFIAEVAAKAESPFHQVTDTFEDYEEENTAIAKEALELLSSHFSLPAEAIHRGLQQRPPCRMEIFSSSQCPFPSPPEVILDVAHNPDGFDRLFKSLKKRSKFKKFRIVCGLSKSKEIEACLLRILPFHQHLHFVAAENGRGLEPQALEEAARRCGFPEGSCSVHPILKEGLQQAFKLATEKEEALLICGTFFIMGAARELLGIQEPKDLLDLNERKGQ